MRPLRRTHDDTRPDDIVVRPSARSRDQNSVGRFRRLIGQIAKGDDRAFMLLYDAFSPTVYGMAVGVAPHPSEAAAVTQRAFVELWRQSPRFDIMNGDVHAWAAALVHRCAVDHARQRLQRGSRPTHHGVDEH